MDRPPGRRRRRARPRRRGGDRRHADGRPWTRRCARSRGLPTTQRCGLPRRGPWSLPAAAGAAAARPSPGSRRSVRPRRRSIWRSSTAPPGRALGDGAVAAGRGVPMPGSTSFPSGHAASAFAFAVGTGNQVPLLALPLNVAGRGGRVLARAHRGALPLRRRGRRRHRRRRRRPGLSAVAPQGVPAATRSSGGWAPGRWAAQSRQPGGLRRRQPASCYQSHFHQAPLATARATTSARAMTIGCTAVASCFSLPDRSTVAMARSLLAPLLGSDQRAPRKRRTFAGREIHAPLLVRASGPPGDPLLCACLVSGKARGR